MKQGIFMRSLASDATEATIDIVGEIGWEVNYPLLRDMLRAIPESIERVIFEIFSPGGDVWEGNAIIQEIGELGKRCTTVARVQVAASMATLIAVACKERSIAQNGRWLIHNAWSMTVGDAAEMEKMAQSLRDCEKEAAAFYAQQCGGTAEAMTALMTEERWMMSNEVKELGFVQEISDPFATEDFEEVRKELAAAGKWPKALAELPEPKPEGDTNAGNANDGAAQSAAASTGTPDEPTGTTYEQGVAHAEVAHAEVVLLLQDKLTELTAAMVKRDALIADLQSAKDKTIGEAESAAKAAKETIEKLTASLKRATERANKLLSGALSFTPAGCATWEEALADCDGDYAKAAKKHDSNRELRDAFALKHKS